MAKRKSGKGEPAAIYVLHFDPPMPRGVSKRGTQLWARNYVGSTPVDRVETRIAEHLSGKGANIVRVAVERGIQVSVACVLQGTRGDEVHLKRQIKNSQDICPTCGGSGRLPQSRVRRAS